MTRLTATCGQSTLKAGSTRFTLGIVKGDGTLVAREMQHQFRPLVSDVTRIVRPASTQGSNSGVLGQWVVRDIEVPDNQTMFLSWSIKSSSMPIAKTLTFGIKCDDQYPHIEMEFPVVTDKHSTFHTLPLTGRFRLMSIAEIHEDRENIKGLSLTHSNAIDTLEMLSEEGVLNYWKALCLPANDGGKTFLAVQGSASFEEYHITVKYHLPGIRPGSKAPAGKTVKTNTGRKVIITSRKRRLRLS